MGDSHLWIKNCIEGNFEKVFEYSTFSNLTDDQINTGYYHSVDNGHSELSVALHATGRIKEHTNSMAFVVASEKCNLKMAQQTYNSNYVEFSEVSWALHKANKNKCSEVIKWLKTLQVTK